jgi:hypothetical protein
MNKQAILIFVFLMVTTSLTQRHMIIFQQLNQAGTAHRLNAENDCIGIFSSTYPFLSGRAGGAYTCRAWSARGCSNGGGAMTFVTSAGTNFWPTGVQSIMC